MHLLDELKEERVFHVQCHFGQDSISLNRVGAEIVGINLSD